MTPSLDEIPVCPADPDELRRLAASVEAASSATRLATDHVLFTWGLLPGAYSAPEAGELQHSLRQLGPAGTEIDTGLRRARAAIETLAEDLEAADRQREALIEEVRQHAATAHLAFPEAQDAFGQRLLDVARIEREAAFRRQCDALAEHWNAAAQACAAALRAIPDVSWTLARDLPAREDVLAAPSSSILDDAALPLLHRLAGRDGVDAARLLRENPEWAAIIRRGRPEAVASWWAQLSPTVAAALATGVPALIGNLDGVAPADRVAANRARAAAHLTDLDRERRDTLQEGRESLLRSDAKLYQMTARVAEIDREIAYFEAVRVGEKQLYAWDSDHGSLVEMSGNPATAKAALFVVPGTNTTAGSFYGDEPVTRFANWQVKGGRGDVVALTVLTGPMPQLSDIPVGGGPQWNHYALERAPEYAQIVEGMKAARPDLWTMSYEHSYGGGIGSAAEAYGATVDARFLAASVGAMEGYVPSDDTAYYSAQGPDDINRYYAGVQLGPLGFGESPESIANVQIVDSGLPGANPVKLVIGAPLAVADSVDHHNALMSDDERINGTVLNAVNQILNKAKAHL